MPTATKLERSDKPHPRLPEGWELAVGDSGARFVHADYPDGVDAESRDLPTGIVPFRRKALAAFEAWQSVKAEG